MLSVQVNKKEPKNWLMRYIKKVLNHFRLRSRSHFEPKSNGFSVKLMVIARCFNPHCDTSARTPTGERTAACNPGQMAYSRVQYA